MLNKWIFSVLLGLSISVCFAQSTLPLDTFGISMFYETKTGTQSWNSAHWGNGIARTIRYAPDPHDPTDWTEDHSASTQGFIIDGQGMMSMAGGPRFHINSLRTKKVPAQFFLNTEFTAYYRRIGSGGTGGCSYTDEKYIINPGQGTFLMRTDDAGADYKMVSIREIDLDKATTSIRQSNPSIKQSKPAKMQLEIRPPSMRTKSNESIKKVNLQGAKAQ